MRYQLAIAIAVITLIGCPPSPQPPTPDASDGAAPNAPDASPPPVVVDAAPTPAGDAGPVSPACASACATLVTMGCPEGASPNCASAMQYANDNRTIKTGAGPALTCTALAGAGNVAAVQALGIPCVVAAKKK